jgi:hypothetical protein
MIKRALRTVLALALMLGVSSGPACLAALSHAWKPHCQKSRAHDDGIFPADSASCRLQPCRPDSGQALMLPDSFPRRLEKEQQDNLRFLNTAVSADLLDNLSVPCFRLPAGGPLPVHPPPIFLVNCSFLC